MWVIIISILAVGLMLIILELIFIPGTTLVGLLGLVFSITGIIITYRHFGNEIGRYVLVGASVATAAALFYGFRSGAWSKFSLKSTIKSKVNEGSSSLLNTGDEGITLSALRPMGNAEFNNQIHEVRTVGEYVLPQQRVKILRIEGNQIIVEKIA